MATITTAQRSSILLILILALGSVTQAKAAPPMMPTRIDIFATSDQPISAVQAIAKQFPGIELRIHKLDGIKQLEATLSAGLPADADEARQLALRRLRKVGKETRSELQHSATALALALQYAVKQYPAIVFDGELVVYGVTDLSVALIHYRHWRQGDTP